MDQKIIVMQDPENKLSPIPASIEKYREKCMNFGLYFQKFGKYQFKQNGGKNELKTQQTWTNGKKGKERKDYEWSLIKNQLDHYINVCQYSTHLLESKHKQQCGILSFYKNLGSIVIDLTAENVTPFLTGIGETTPTEVGMVFDRNTGLPFIPASTIKGVVRQAYCINFITTLNNLPKENGDVKIDERDVPGLIELFGALDPKIETKGGFSFIDAYPSIPPNMFIDIMNPHFGQYYQGKSKVGPVETEDPTPIKFLALEKGTHFSFRGFFLHDSAVPYRRELMAAYNSAFSDIGMGAKTAVGYGRFRIYTIPKKNDVLLPNDEPVESEAPLSKDPEAERDESLKLFENSLPLASHFPGQALEIVMRVQSQADEKLQKSMCKVLVTFAKSLPRKIKFQKALADNKKWASSLAALCDHCGIEY